MLYFSATVETAVTVQKSQQGPVQGVTVTTGLLGLAHSGRMESLPCTHLKHDIQTMREIEKTWGLSTTQSNEAANRALSSRCPQNVKFSKSITARLGSAILTCNDSPGDAQRKISHRLGLPMSRGQKRYHAAEQKRNTYSQGHSRSPSTQTRHLQQDAKMRRDKLKRRQQTQLPSDYKKHQLDDSSSSSDSIPDGESPEKRLHRSVRRDHKYHCL